MKQQKIIDVVAEIDDNHDLSEGIFFQFGGSGQGKISAVLYENHILIQRRGFLQANLMGGYAGDKKIFYDKIGSIQIKQPGLGRGWIQFSVLGETVKHKGTSNISKDENSIILVGDLQYQFALFIQKQIEKRQLVISTPVSIVSQQSQADELRKFKELLDDNIITEDEFNEKKKQILGL